MCFIKKSCGGVIGRKRCGLSSCYETPDRGRRPDGLRRAVFLAKFTATEAVAAPTMPKLDILECDSVPIGKNSIRRVGSPTCPRVGQHKARMPLRILPNRRLVRLPTAWSGGTVICPALRSRVTAPKVIAV